MNSCKFFLVLVSVFLTGHLFAQSVGINADGTVPNSSAMLDVSAPNKGLLIPQIHLTGVNDVTTISSPAASLLVYNLAITNGLVAGYYYNGGTAAAPVWTKLATGVVTVGPAGATGNQGLQGIQGVVGAAGPKGDLGLTGAAGTTGTTGSVGAKGDTGLAGANGINGVNGAAGTIGTTGAVGQTGATGSVGVSGAYVGETINWSGSEWRITGTSGLALGRQAGLNSQGVFAVALGLNAGQSAQGTYAIAVGNSAGLTNQGSGSVALGNSSGSSNQQSYSVAIGNGAGRTNQQSTAVALGNSAGYDSQAINAVAVGNSAGLRNQGSGSVALGYSSGFLNQQSYSVAIGNGAGQINQGANSVAIGALAGNVNQYANSIAINATGGSLDIANSGFFVKPVTSSASTNNPLVYNSTTGEITYNSTTGLGAVDLTSGVTGILPVANGGTGSATQNFVDLTTAQTIAGAKAFNSDLTVHGLTIGYGAGQNSENTAIGVGALANSTIWGQRNTAIGNGAMLRYNGTSFDNNTSVGYANMQGLTTGEGNTSIGGETLLGLGSGSHNTAIGNHTLMSTTGNTNTALGANSGGTITGGSSNTTIGFAADVAVGTFVNATAIGAEAIVDASNTIQLGNNDVTNVNTSADMFARSFNATSDKRLKRNIAPLHNSIGAIMQLKPVSYEKKSTLASTNYSIKENGFIAQELQKVMPSLVTEGTDKDKLLSVNYIALIPVLTKAIQEQQNEIEELKKMVERLIKKK